MFRYNDNRGTYLHFVAPRYQIVTEGATCKVYLSTMKFFSLKHVYRFMEECL